VSRSRALRQGIDRGLEWLVQWDIETMHAVSSHPALRRLGPAFVSATFLGDGYLWGALALGLILFGSPTDRSHVLIALGITVVNVSLFQLFKLLFTRPRPTAGPLALLSRLSDSYSFPSGHTTIAFGVAWTVAVLYPRMAYQLATFFGAVTISVSRVYLREHYPFDVIGGALLGSVTALYLLPVFMRLLL